MLSRRSFRVVGAVCVIAVIVGGIVVFAQSSKDTGLALRNAQAEADACRQHLAVAQGGGPNGAAVVPGGCPTAQELLPSFDKRFVYAVAVPSTTRNIALPLFFVAFALAASFIGAEFGTGMMTTTLTWEPRRGRVLLAKAVPAFVVLGAAVIVLLAFMAVAYIPIGALRGTTAGMSGGFWEHLTGLWLRAAGLAVFGAALGIGLATLARNTVAALGIGFLYVAIIDPIVSHLWRGRFAPWLLMHNLQRAMRLPVETTLNRTAIGHQEALRVLSGTRPAILLTIYGIALLLAAYGAFRARDVT
jgi:hypothetical protein